MSFVDNLARKIAESPNVSSVTGVFLGMVGPLARVNLQGSVVEIRCDGWNPPLAGMPVRVETVRGVMRVVGPSQTLPARAEVVESLASDTKAMVAANGSEWVLSVMAPYVPIPGDVVVVNWQSGHVLGEEAAEPEEAVLPAPPPIPGTGFQDLLVQATDSGKWDLNYSNWWGGTEVWASNNNRGAWFYGGRFAVLAGANVSQVEMFLPLISTVGSCSIGIHPHPVKSGAPSISSFEALPTRTGWVRLPDWWGNFLRDNPGSGLGVVAPSGGLTKWRGVPGGAGSDGMSGALRFAGTR